MQTHGGSAADAAITATERYFRVDLRVDWARDGKYQHPLSDLSPFVTKVVTDRAFKGGLPEELSLVEGAGAAELDVDLQGEFGGQQLDWILSPYNGRSQLFQWDLVGAELRYRLGIDTVIGTVWYDQFVGTIRSIVTDRGPGEARLSALDRVELLRVPVRFPRWALSEFWQVRGSEKIQHADGQWVIDHCLRHAGVSPTPWRPTRREDMGVARWKPGDGIRENTQLWITGNGSYLPTIGWLDNFNAWTLPKDDAGELYSADAPLHPAAPAGSPKQQSFRVLPDTFYKYWYGERTLTHPNGRTVVSFTLNTSGPEWDRYKKFERWNDIIYICLGASYEIFVSIGQQGKVWTTFAHKPNKNHPFEQYWPGPALTIPDEPNPRITVVWDPFADRGVSAYMQAGSARSGTDWSVVGTKIDFLNYDHPLTGLVHVNPAVSMSDIAVSNALNERGKPPSNFLGWAGQPAKYTAVLDRSLNRLSHMPARHSDDAWEVIADVASAEMGAAYWDESGVFRFLNRDTLDTKAKQIVRKLTLDEVTGLKLEHTVDSIRNIYSIETTRKIAGAGRIFEAHSVDEFFIPRGEARRYQFSFDDVVCPDPGYVWRATTNPDNTQIDPKYGTRYIVWGDFAEHAYIVQFWNTGGNGRWQENDGAVDGVDILWNFDFEGNIIAGIFNGYGEDARLVANGTNQPALRVYGTKIYDNGRRTTEYSDATSVNRYGGRNLRLAGNWIQPPYNATGLITRLLAKTSRPIPFTDAITIAGDPRLQLGDTLRISDDQGYGAQIDVQIQGIRREWSVDDGLADTLTVETILPPRTGLWDSPAFSRWDTTLIWS
ncbi:hypothetical protein [Lentzea flava]|uniref:Minor tail protein n=1 Tax=Lentzea flava TaxID=103732 RepID=A0ABQ2UR97_9PSEU|nr:hypothetical protein [Lentzea flava]MCP2200075.1 hypothetical protein [Lentzea flava]GGU45955.1 hypothetical protein GCM10010178_43100 [Lentzea flava]